MTRRYKRSLSPAAPARSSNILDLLQGAGLAMAGADNGATCFVLNDGWVKLGISPSLIRLSCGIEDTADLVADLEQALGTPH